MARAKVCIPVSILRRAVRAGWTLTKIRRNLEETGLKVSHETIRHRLGEMGLVLPGQYYPATPERVAERRQSNQGGSGPRIPRVVGRVPRTNIGLFAHDERLLERMRQACEQYLQKRHALQWEAKNGCQEAA